MDLASAIDSGTTILLDGAMGTQLAARGLEMGGRNNLSHPNVVLAIHRAYAGIGCNLIANTLTMNRIYLETHRLAVDVREVNLAGAGLARTVAGRDRYVLGDLSSTGQMLEPYGDYTEAQFYEAFKEQAGYLSEGGVDGFIIETVLDLREAVCAVRACRDAAPLPVIASLSFHTAAKGGRTIMGNSARDVAIALAEAGVSALGANCGDLDPQETAAVIALMREATTLPLLAQPNAGKPRLEDDRTVFDLSPEEFAAGMKECIRAGATIVGGCCGTSPEHIRELAKLLTDYNPKRDLQE